jgi:hypothetical protein
MKRKQYSIPVALPINGHTDEDNRLVADVMPKAAKLYELPGLDASGISRMKNGQYNVFARLRLVVYAIRLAGHERSFGERIRGWFDALIEECWPVREIDDTQAECDGAAADAHEDALFALWKNGRVSDAEYEHALSLEVDAKRTRLISLRYRIASMEQPGVWRRRANA